MMRSRQWTASAVISNRGLLKLATRGSHALSLYTLLDLDYRKNRQGLLMHLLRMHYARHEYGAVRKVGDGIQMRVN